MKKVVVTGGCGFIGSHIVEEAVSRDYEVTIIDNLNTGYKKNIEPYLNNPKVKWVNASILDQAVLNNEFKGVNYVFHLAALISVPESMDKPHDYIDINVQGTLNVLEACKKNGVESITLSSSAAIYGDNPVIPKEENMAPEPKSPYAITKLDGEYYFDLYAREHGIRATALRYFNVFGPRQDPQSQYAAAMPIFISKAVNNQPITIYGDGNQTRDFVYVKDVVQANFLAAEKGQVGVYNTAWGQRITIKDLAEKIIELTNSKSEINHLPERAGDIKHSMASNQKIIDELQFKASSDLDSGISATIDYFTSLNK
ncbi:SDR family oxidoreductase [Francisellaceae bacterium]|nr:SDR family oxidoreductase [Francisellaceae bacterium]